MLTLKHPWSEAQDSPRTFPMSSWGRRDTSASADLKYFVSKTEETHPSCCIIFPTRANCRIIFFSLNLTKHLMCSWNSSPKGRASSVPICVYSDVRNHKRKIEMKGRWSIFEVYFERKFYGYLFERPVCSFSVCMYILAVQPQCCDHRRANCSWRQKCEISHSVPVQQNSRWYGSERKHTTVILNTHTLNHCFIFLSIIQKVSTLHVITHIQDFTFLFCEPINGVKVIRKSFDNLQYKIK